MKQTIKFLALSLVFACSGVTHAVVVTFDDFPHRGEIVMDGGGPMKGALFHNGHFEDFVEIGYVHNGYQGLNWSGTKILAANNSRRFEGTGFINGIVSGDTVAHGDRMNVSSVQGSLFDFNGAYLTGVWDDGFAIEVSGFVNDVLTYTETVIVNSASATWFDFDFLGIDSLNFKTLIGEGYSGTGYPEFAMDNFTFNKVSDVPLPAAVWLFGAGFCMFAGLRRRKQKDAVV